MWWKITLLILAGLTAVTVAVLVYSSYRWQFNTKAMLHELEASQRQIKPRFYDAREIDGLPVPVQKYFNAVLQNGQPMITAATVEHSGSFNLSQTGENWKPFTSMQHVNTYHPGFVWDARIKMAPGLVTKVHDAYVSGDGILHAALFGLLSLVNLRGTPEMAQGELMRFFAEAVWYPTALLPSQGVLWEAVDDRTARATFKDRETELTMLFQFDTDGLVQSIRSEARMRMIGDTMIATPWECSVSAYELHSGMRIPVSGEVRWILAEGSLPYWRGRIGRIRYEFAH